MYVIRSRSENLAKAEAFEASGNMSAANEHYQRAVDISPAVAKQLIDVSFQILSLLCILLTTLTETHAF